MTEVQRLDCRAELKVLAHRTQKLRKDRNWSQRRLASEAGCSNSTISWIERGEADPALSILCGIARAFGIRLDRFLKPPLADHHRSTRK